MKRLSLILCLVSVAMLLTRCEPHLILEGITYDRGYCVYYWLDKQEGKYQTVVKPCCSIDSTEWEIGERIPKSKLNKYYN